jgi:phytoene dehydrogenase-like protein
MRPVETVVIIGGGVSGLAAGGLLARNGFAVKLFEANDKLGGSCATTTLDGYTFNDGAVYLPLAGVLDRVFARVGLDRTALLPLRKITANLSTTLPDGSMVTLNEGLDLSVEGRSIDGERVRGELQRMVEKWDPVLRLITGEISTRPYSPWRILRKGWRHLYKLRGTAASELRRLVTDDGVRAALSGSLLYCGLPSQKMPVVAILGLIAMLSEGFHLPEGGMGRIPEVLSLAVQRHGGQIFLDSKVEKIVVERGRACAVEIAGRGRVEAGAVISSVSGMLTFGPLMAPEDAPKAMKRRVRRARLSHQAVSLQFGLSNTIDARSYLNMGLPMMERQREVFAQAAREVEWPVYFVPTVTMPELAPQGGSVIEMFHPVISGTAINEWDERSKELITDSALKTLGRFHDLDVVVTRVRSPRDFRDSMHLFQGALYGLSPAVGPHEQFPHATPLPGLYLAGQSTYPGYGVAASATSGIFAAEALIRSREPRRNASGSRRDDRGSPLKEAR